MLSIAELLNPLDSVPDDADLSQPPPEQQRNNSSGYSSRRRHSEERSRLNIERQRSSSSTAQGPINFPPFQNVNDETIREIGKYRIPQFGHIHQGCEHIPYNSSKRDFTAKTGREFIEAFKYTFQIPGQATVYTVLWDFTIGLVRVTPFFKCMGYTKTKPSQALDKNPGLRDVCPSITGGAVFAQGYWMPFYCAKALCATFCHDISGALIPVFGPDFPSHCALPGSPRFGDMTISQQLIAEALNRGSSSNRRSETEIGGHHITPHDALGQGSAMPRRASMPTTAPLGIVSGGADRRHVDEKVTRKRHGDTRDVENTVSGLLMATSAGRVEASDVAGESQPDCEDREGRCVDARHAQLYTPHGRRPLQDEHHTTGDLHKRRKLADESPLMAGAYQPREGGTLGRRRALPESRGPVQFQRRGKERVVGGGEADHTEVSTKSASRRRSV